MANDANWLLPEGVEEILPGQANQLESLRRAILDDLQQRGFDLVMPPVMEFVDALLTGTGAQLDTQTYKFMDQHTHRMLGIRADMTPQIARIDAHYLSHNKVNRLCYAGTVLRTRPSHMGGPRELLQVGAELFGVADESADIEIIDAMLQSLKLANTSTLTLSLGHVGIYNALLSEQDIDSKLEGQLVDIFMRKSTPDLQQLDDTFAQTNDAPDLSAFHTLMSLQGGVDVLTQAAQQLPKIGLITQSIEQLKSVVMHCQNTHPQLNIHIDLADVSGRDYHTGLKFNAFVTDEGRAIAKGGRYDRIGEKFGHARPATGFSADLKSLIQLSQSN